MEVSTVMDLPALFHHVPSLLHACISNDDMASLGGAIPHLRLLRLVNKECSKVSLMGLRSYSLTLAGLPGPLRDTHIGCVKLLQHSCLEALTVRLLVSGSHNPALELQRFVQGAEVSLSTVTSLNMFYTDTSDSAESAPFLGEVVHILARACSSVKTLTFREELPMAFLQSLGRACPLLTSLVIECKQRHMPYLQHVLLLQPSMLPNISSLSLPSFADKLPDMSNNTGITSLKMRFVNIQQDHWLCLPRKLKHLVAQTIYGKLCNSFTSKQLIRSLLSVTINIIYLPLQEAAMLLRESLFFSQVKPCAFVITCKVDKCTAADMKLFHQKLCIEGPAGSTFEFHCKEGTDDARLHSFLSSSPCMTGVLKCGLNCLQANLLPMLRSFPDITHLRITSSVTLTDLDLHTLIACPHLSQLTLEMCDIVTPMGLLALCMHFPQLRYVFAFRCEQLQGPAFELLTQLVDRYGLSVNLGRS